jgi:hypothetical protein
MSSPSIVTTGSRAFRSTWCLTTTFHFSRGADALQFAAESEQVEIGLEDLRLGPPPFDRERDPDLR